MSKEIRRWSLAVAAVLALISTAAYLTHKPTKGTRLAGPKIVLWAWERPEDLRFLDSHEMGVAFLASSVELVRDEAQVYPRMQPLRVAPDARLVAVVRVYSHSNAPAALNDEQRKRVVETALAATRQAQAYALQIDFDARASERDFYLGVLSDLRRELGSGYPISMTALVSWCIGDRWIRDLPVNEAVPMFFEMGRDTEPARRYLLSHDALPEPLCRGSVGISTGEPWPGGSLRGKRVYIFSHNAWTPEMVEAVRARLP